MSLVGWQFAMRRSPPRQTYVVWIMDHTNTHERNFKAKLISTVLYLPFSIYRVGISIIPPQLALREAKAGWRRAAFGQDISVSLWIRRMRNVKRRVLYMYVGSLLAALIWLTYDCARILSSCMWIVMSLRIAVWHLLFHLWSHHVVLRRHCNVSQIELAAAVLKWMLRVGFRCPFGSPCGLSATIMPIDQVLRIRTSNDIRKCRQMMIYSHWFRWINDTVRIVRLSTLTLGDAATPANHKPSDLIF